MFGKKVKMIGKLTALFCCTALLAGCGQENKTENGEKAEYVSITPKEAKEIMDSDAGYIILDVRTQEEYDAGHIPGAVLIPDYEIADRAAAELTDREQIILVYCRSWQKK